MFLFCFILVKVDIQYKFEMASNLASLTATRTFNLNIHVTDLQTQKNIEVNQESHVGFVMLELVEKLGGLLNFFSIIIAYLSK